ncbi:uncharacterized protein UV8b_08170 [Ustilaginoidea virens]|uniref:Uncharacterized protein n=1 Tax=Ustilaginoidea virens TaxID=1159556 RepID=A0A8E5HYD0_USTVR|nr:uncharacterized protein UV8b_08170 [Ustilaginoidea virens]QUC23929.1 hypothetical protein UV8b_08170 [Ustilaginoidea virens]
MTDSDQTSSEGITGAGPLDCGALGTPSREPCLFQGDSMLSVDFSNPLSGAARSERIRQLSHNHPAFEKSRVTQEILVKIQQSLRRMPGVSSAESSEAIAQLQEVGQIVNQETCQLVDALTNITLDQEDTDKAIARMGLEASLAKATIEDQAQTIRDLRGELSAEAKKRQEAESHVEKAVNELHELTGSFKDLKDKADRSEGSEAGRGPDPRDAIIKGLEDGIRHLEDQVNNRRSLWVMKHSDPQSVARAIETLADSIQNNETAHQTIMSMKPAFMRGGSGSGSRLQVDDDTAARAGYADPAPPARPPSVFQPFHRPTTAAPPKFGPLQAGPPRAPSAFSQERRYPTSIWNPAQNPFHTPGAPPPSSFGRPPAARKTHRYRASNAAAAAAAEAHGGIPESTPNRPGTALGHRHYYPECVPQTPTSGRGRCGRFPGDGGGSGSNPSSGTSTTLVGRSALLPGPLIHMTERSVAAWNESIMEFYALIRAFVERHASVPDPAMALRISTTHLWPVLLATYHPLSAREATSYLDLHLRDDNPKCCLVTRVIIDYIVNRVWVPHAWTGSSDAQATYALMDLEKELEKTQGQPSAQRQPLLDKQALYIDAILKTEPPAFHASRVQDMTAAMLATIQPLLNRLHNPADAHRDMELVADHAWELSSRILTSRLTFDFRFPEVGSRFSSQSMLPIWPALDPTELQAKHWRVALVTTPVITCRNDTGSNISAHSVALADVYCMQ